ncbi:MAG TPA: nicotinamidase [Solirubrobacterales bacterium]|nr:nicotinamidase [Solirubrobacterales bacterium]
MAKALLIIDFQNDFTSGGALEVPEGDEVAEPVKRLADQFDVVVATRDWHPPDHASFETQGGPWPVHCVQGTHGAQLHPAMEDVALDAMVDVGRERDDEGYSGFEKSDLAQILRDHDVDEVYVCGLATDYCVRASAIDARREGFDVTVVEDAIRGVDVREGDSERALRDMREAGARSATSEEVLARLGAAAANPRR